MTWSAGCQKFEQDKAIAAFAEFSNSQISTEWRVIIAYKTNESADGSSSGKELLAESRSSWPMAKH